MNKAICEEAGGRDRITDLMVAASGTSCNCNTPPMIKHTSHGFWVVFVHIWRVCVSFVASSHLMGLLLNISHTNLSSPWQHCVTRAPANTNVCMCLSGRQEERWRRRARERKSDWVNSTLSWTAVLNQNGGWKLGAHQGSLHYTHLIEGAGWKDAG